MIVFLSLMASPICLFAALGTEDYAVYSVVLANIPSTDAHAKQRLLIARDILNSSELQSPLKICSNLPPDLKTRVEDVLTANHDSRDIPGALEKEKLKIDRPHVVITSGQGDEWRRIRFS